MLDLGRFPYITDPADPTKVLNVILVEEEAYELTSTTILYNASGDRVAVGALAIIGASQDGTDGALRANDTVSNIVLNADGTVKSLVGTKLAVQDAAIEAVWTAAKAGTLAATDFDAVAGLEYVAGNLSAYQTAIAAKAKADVNTLAKLQAVIDKVDGDELADAKADVIADKADVNVTAAAGETLTAVKTDITLVFPATEGSTVTWESNNAAIVIAGTESNGDTITAVRPNYGDGNASVKLTATITKGGYSETKEFNLVVLEKEPTDAELAFEAVNNARTVAEMREALEDVNLGLDGADLTAYNALTPDNLKNMVAESVLNARPADGFADLDAVKAAFNAAL